MKKADGANPLSWAFWFGELDLRPIALFRIALGLLILFNLLDLAPNLTAWFSDEGLLPRPLLLSSTRHDRFSLHDAFGTPTATWVYWFLAMTVASAMTVGYRTRSSQVLTYVFFAGYNERLVYVFDGSDAVLRFALFFLIFCQSGNRYSRDAVNAAAAGRPLPERGSAFPIRLIQLFVALMYLGSALHKLAVPMWLDGTALHYVLSIPHTLTRDWATVLADSAFIVKAGTWYGLVSEILFIALVFSPFMHRRAKAIGLLIGLVLHVGISFALNIGLFSYLMPITYLAYFEPEWTERAVALLRRFCGNGKTRVYFDGACPRCRFDAARLREMDTFGNLALADDRETQQDIAGHSALRAIGPDGDTRTGFDALAATFARLPGTFALAAWMRLPGVRTIGAFVYDRISQDAHGPGGWPGVPPPPGKPIGLLRVGRPVVYSALFAILLCAQLSAWPAEQARWVPRTAMRVLLSLSLSANWNMFAPPRQADYRLYAPALFSDGSHEDLLSVPEGWLTESRSYFYTRWWKYLDFMATGDGGLARDWARWQCREHNLERTPERLLRIVTVIVVFQPTPPIGEPSPEPQKVTLVRHECSGAGAS
jgi:predicted DCC family thiol-disulfide oxidoreductase YuxK